MRFDVYCYLGCLTLLACWVCLLFCCLVLVLLLVGVCLNAFAVVFDWLFSCFRLGFVYLSVCLLCLWCLLCFGNSVAYTLVCCVTFTCGWSVYV